MRPRPGVAAVPVVFGWSFIFEASFVIGRVERSGRTPRHWQQPARASPMAPSYGEIQVVAPFADDALAIGAMAQVVHRHAVEAGQQLALQLQPEGPNHLAAERRAGFFQQRFVAVVVADGADDLAHADAASLPRQAITAARPAYADQDAAAHP